MKRKLESDNVCEANKKVKRESWHDEGLLCDIRNIHVKITQKEDKYNKKIQELEEFMNNPNTKTSWGQDAIKKYTEKKENITRELKEVKLSFESFYENYDKNFDEMIKLHPKIFAYENIDGKDVWGDPQYDIQHVSSHSIHKLMEIINIEKTKEYIVQQFKREFLCEEQDVMDRYTSNSFNFFWRAFEDIHNKKISYENMDNRCKTFLNIFDKSDWVPNELLLFEGQGLNEDIDNLEVGKIYTRGRLTSTSLSPLVAASFANTSKKIPNLIIYKIVGKVKGVVVKNSFSGICREYEIILQPNIQFKVKSIKQTWFAMRSATKECVAAGIKKINMCEVEIINE